MSSPCNQSANPELIVALIGLIRDQMKLPEDRALIYNQDWRFPNTTDLFAILAFQWAKPYGASRSTINRPADPETGDPGGLNEVQTLNQQETYRLTLLSRSDAARLRKHEAIFALNSTRAQVLAESLGFKIGHIPQQFVDASRAEGPAMVNRYDLSFNVLYGYEQTQPIDYYDHFSLPSGKALLINP